MVSRDLQRSQRTARLQELRARELLSAAQSLFAERGFAAVTIQAIADAAGIAKGTVYLYFRSKEDVYWAIVRQRLADLHEISGRAVAGAADTASKIRAFVATRLLYFDQQREFFSIYVVELGRTLVGRQPPTRELEEMHLEQVEVLRTLLEEGIARGEVRPVRADITAHALLELVRSRVALRLRGWSTVDREQELEDLLALLWEGIAPKQRGNTPDQGEPS